MVQGGVCGNYAFTRMVVEGVSTSENTLLTVGFYVASKQASFCTCVISKKTMTTFRKSEVSWLS